MGRSKRRVNRKKRKAQVRPRAKTFKNRAINLADALSLAGQNISKGDFDGAETVCKDILRLFPNNSDALYTLAVVLSHKEQDQEAKEVIEKAIATRPDHAESYWVLGLLLGKEFRYDDAVAAYQNAIELQPSFLPAHNNIGVTFQNLGRNEEAEQVFRKIIELQPNDAQAYNNLGIILTELSRFDEASDAFRQAVKLKENYPEAYHNLGRALSLDGDLREAGKAYKKAFELNPNHSVTIMRIIELKKRLCYWDGLDELISHAADSVGNNSEVIEPFTLQFILPSLRQQQLCTRQAVKKKLMSVKRLSKKLNFTFSKIKKPRITVGYISPDFRYHAAATLMAKLFEHHDRDRFQIFGYSLGPDDGSPMRQWFSKAFDKFLDISKVSLTDAAGGIYDDGVDILVDLGGYTAHVRTEILALKPAPIQVNYLGSGATMGVDFMDYMIVDKFIILPGQEQFFDEKLVYLPDCFMVSDSKRPVSEQTPSRAACGLPEDGIVLCCFSNSFKFTAEMFDVWMRILAAVPSAVLWLVEFHKQLSLNIKRNAEKRGIDPDRLVFTPVIDDRAEHLARYRIADLFLDTLVVSAGATASDALMMGCPILACAGKTLHSRVAGSMLRAIGLEELITSSLADYERLALDLARNPDRLGALRAKLKENIATAPLFNCERTTRHIESAYQTMWDRYLNNLDPESFSV